jgi:hypothetical protein
MARNVEASECNGRGGSNTLPRSRYCHDGVECQPDSAGDDSIAWPRWPGKLVQWRYIHFA